MPIVSWFKYCGRGLVGRGAVTSRANVIVVVVVMARCGTLSRDMTADNGSDID